MADLSASDVRRVAVLARLQLSDEEVAGFATQLGDVLSYVELLQELDTTGVEPMVHAIELTNVLREDTPRPSLPVEQAMQNAPQSDGATFLVPPILGSH